MIEITENKVNVSIHTPIQGVTPIVSIHEGVVSVSIHTPIQGVTTGKLERVEPTGFNPHTHTGCDLEQQGTCLADTSFNPHTHTGCDSSTLYSFRASQQFQSTHPYRV